jgi:hypothetical protein
MGKASAGTEWDGGDVMNMGRIPKKRNRGVTLIEVMIASLAVIVILVGVMQFQYLCALDAHKADVQATGARLGLLVMEGWKVVAGELTYDPLNDFNLILVNEFVSIPDPGIPGLPTFFRAYRVDVDGVKYFVKLSYDDTSAPRTLNVAVAWSRDFGSETLEFDAGQLVSLTKYATYSTG